LLICRLATDAVPVAKLVDSKRAIVHRYALVCALLR
jgi:hypothetical protein